MSPITRGSNSLVIFQFYGTIDYTLNLMVVAFNSDHGRALAKLTKSNLCGESILPSLFLNTFWVFQKQRKKYLHQFRVRVIKDLYDRKYNKKKLYLSYSSLAFWGYSETVSGARSELINYAFPIRTVVDTGVWTTYNKGNIILIFIVFYNTSSYL